MNPYEGLGFGHKGSFQSSDDDDDDDDDDVPQALKSISTFEARNLPLDFDDRERDTNVRYLHKHTLCVYTDSCLLHTNDV